MVTDYVDLREEKKRMKVVRMMIEGWVANGCKLDRGRTKTKSVEVWAIPAESPTVVLLQVPSPDV